VTLLMGESLDDEDVALLAKKLKNILKIRKVENKTIHGTP
jgi:hypothetical protein